MRHSLLSLALLAAACAEVTVDVRNRPCGEEGCVDGYVCHPRSDVCVPETVIGCDGSGICPSAVSAGDACDDVGAFIPCADQGIGCEHGCRTCLEAHTWSTCVADECDIGVVGACGGCVDDCRLAVAHAIPVCDSTGVAPTCAYAGACDPGWADADGNPGNGCECAQSCGTRCAGADGCGGTCTDNCVAPDTCGGGPVDDECGCTPACAGRCAGDDGCAGTCPDTCEAPETCGALVVEKCGCDPACGDRCAGADACGGVCPDTCAAPESCGGGIDPQRCGCTPDCGARCAGTNGCGGTCPDICVPPAFCDTDQLCSCTPDCDGRCGGDNGCGGTCPDNCVAPETCGGGGRTDVCGWWWSCDESYRNRLTVTGDGDAVSAGHSVTIAFDHHDMVFSGQSQASGDDVRVVWWSGGAWTEIDRVLDPTSAWDQVDTRIWFALRSDLGGSASDDRYFVYWGDSSPGAPPADEGQVFHFADYFDRTGNVDNNWLVFAGTSGSVTLQGNQLYFATTADQANRPVVYHDFSALTGRIEWRVGFDWSRPGPTANDPTYWTTMQLGDSSVMEATPSSQPWYYGAGPDLVWGGDEDQGVHETLYYGVAGAGRGGWPISGLHEIRAFLEVGADVYDIWIDGVLRQTDASFSSPRALLDRVRFITNFMGDGGTHRGYDWVIVRPAVDFEPIVSAGSDELADCP